jgi:hypothetical protein
MGKIAIRGREYITLATPFSASWFLPRAILKALLPLVLAVRKTPSSSMLMLNRRAAQQKYLDAQPAYPLSGGSREYYAGTSAPLLPS